MRAINFLKEQHCPIWRTGALVEAMSGGVDVLAVNSARAGGRYTVTGSALPALAALNDNGKKMITSWLVDQRISGEDSPHVNTDVIRRLPKQRFTSYSQRLDRFFRLLRHMRFDFGHYMSATTEVGGKGKPWTAYIAAWCELDTTMQAASFLRNLREAGLLILGQEGLYRPSPEGWSRLDDVNASNAGTSQGFVAMWFDSTMAEIYDRGIADAIVTAGYEPRRIDRVEHINKIDDEIIAEIRRSRFIVVDMTCGVAKLADGKEVTFDRGGVYFEAGFAMGLGLPVIWTVRADMVDKLHFDIRQYSHILWEGADDLREKLRNRIVAIMGEGPSLSKG